MVRCARGECALMDARIDRFEIGGRKDPVELRDGAAAVEAVAGIDEPVRRAEIGEAAPGCAPFVAVAHQNCRQRLAPGRSEEHTSELQSLMRISYAVFCLQ